MEDYELDAQIGYKLRLANQRHLEIFSDEMPEVTPTQFSTLIRLLALETVSQNQLGRLVGMDAATTKGVIARLKKKGFVDVAKSKTDLRRLVITLTDGGRLFAEKAIDHAKTISGRTAENLSEDELADLLRLLDKIA